MKNFLIYIWQLPQHIIGFILKLTSKATRNFDVDGKTVKVYFSNFTFGSGVDLGQYILFDYKKYARRSHYKSFYNRVRHEYGHSRQSIMLGPLYLFAVGIPSALRKIYHNMKHSSWSYAKKTKWYYSSYPENWANKLGNVNF